MVSGWLARLLRPVSFQFFSMRIENEEINEAQEVIGSKSLRS